MNDGSNNSDAAAKQRDKLFEVALATRNLEIDLLWKRSLFFWGFIAAAFVGYSAVLNGTKPDRVIAVSIASFGGICSLCWTLANRGSKYWQQAWEKKLFDTELGALGSKPFATKFVPDPEKLHLWGQWSIKWHFSVSRLAIALSDLTFVLWVVLILRAIPAPKCLWWLSDQMIYSIPILSAGYGLLILRYAASENKDRRSDQGVEG